MNNISFSANQYLAVCFLILSSMTLSAQSKTSMSGIVRDAQTKEVLPFVDVYFENTTVGVSTDIDGIFEITTQETVTNLVVSYVGYQKRKYPVLSGISQTIQIELETDAVELEGATVTAKKQKYSKKNNPAVDLMREVIAHKEQNGINGKDFCSYEKYEKVEVDLNSISEKFKHRKVFKSFDFIWSYLDSTKTESKPFLPILLRETASSVYYRATPNTEKEMVTGTKMSKIDDAANPDNLNEVINTLYQDIDIYENNIVLLRNQFLSPLAPLSISFYRFYIKDTVDVSGKSAVNLYFIPKNQATFGFTGNIYISNDSTYQVLKVDMGLFGDVNLNFVRDIRIEQEFQNVDSTFLLAKDRVKIDYALTEEGLGFYGTKTTHYNKYNFSAPSDMSVFEGIGRETIAENAEEQDDDYWAANRQVPLNTNEIGIYNMIDTLASIPKFKRFKKISQFLVSGYIPTGKVDIGPYATIIGFNNVEGFKLRIGGETNLNFSKKWLLQGFGAYGFGDKRFKYAGFATYSFNDDYLKNPRHYLSMSYAQDTGYPGYEQEFIPENNFLLSFKWGIRDKLLFSNTFRVEYVKENKSLEYGVYYLNTRRQPYGNLSFDYQGTDSFLTVKSINTSEVGLNFRFAPNQQYIQRGKYRYPIYNKYPVFKLSYAAGLKGVLGGDYNYHRLSASIFKRFEMSILGHSNIEISAGKIFGEVPYILMHIPKANQTYAYKTQAYNMMNFMEFVGEEYVSINFRHYFKGFFLNRIPLIKKLEMRELVTFKATWGSVSDKNNPELNSKLIQFPLDSAGYTSTQVLSNKPYMEVGVGITNIAKFFRVDFVQRLSYLDAPNVPQLFGKKGLGLRVRLDVNF